MYVVIPVADEPDNPTLALAIATIREHTDYDIVTIGKDYGLAEHIDMGQGPDPFANTDAAMRLACERFEQFVWSNDDIYWTRPSEPVRWALGGLTHPLGSGFYDKRRRATRNWLLANGLPLYDYEAHVPMRVDAQPMTTVLEAAERNRRMDKRTLYGNLTGLPDVIAADVKVRRTDVARPDSPWISSSDDTFEVCRSWLNVESPKRAAATRDAGVK